MSAFRDVITQAAQNSAKIGPKCLRTHFRLRYMMQLTTNYIFNIF